MSWVLKPTACMVFMSNLDYDERFDIRKLADNLLQGELSNVTSMSYKLRQFDYKKKSHYDALPRPFRRTVAESTLFSRVFSIDSFYEYVYPRELIYKEYCETFFDHGYINKSVDSFYKKLKKEHPEYFL